MSDGREITNDNANFQSNLALKEAEKKFIESVETLINFYKNNGMLKGLNWNIDILPLFINLVARGIENVYFKNEDNVNK